MNSKWLFLIKLWGRILFLYNFWKKCSEIDFQLKWYDFFIDRFTELWSCFYTPKLCKSRKNKWDLNMILLRIYNFGQSINIQRQLLRTSIRYAHRKRPYQSQITFGVSGSYLLYKLIFQMKWYIWIIEHSNKQQIDWMHSRTYM